MRHTKEFMAMMGLNKLGKENHVVEQDWHGMLYDTCIEKIQIIQQRLLICLVFQITAFHHLKMSKRDDPAV